MARPVAMETGFSAPDDSRWIIRTCLKQDAQHVIDADRHFIVMLVGSTPVHTALLVDDTFSVAVGKLTSSTV